MTSERPGVRQLSVSFGRRRAWDRALRRGVGPTHTAPVLFNVRGIGHVVWWAPLVRPPSQLFLASSPAGVLSSLLGLRFLLIILLRGLSSPPAASPVCCSPLVALAPRITSLSSLVRAQCRALSSGLRIVPRRLAKSRCCRTLPAWPSSLVIACSSWFLSCVSFLLVRFPCVSCSLFVSSRRCLRRTLPAASPACSPTAPSPAAPSSDLPLLFLVGSVSIS